MRYRRKREAQVRPVERDEGREMSAGPKRWGRERHTKGRKRESRIRNDEERH